eukprot:6012286-Alexandrium_andersonii.AAC.1
MPSGARFHTRTLSATSCPKVAATPRLPPVTWLLARATDVPSPPPLPVSYTHLRAHETSAHL